MAVDRIPKALDALADYRVPVGFDRVYVLQEQRHGESHRGWVPVADYPFEPAAVIGRGGLPLELTLSRLADPEVRRFETGDWPADDPGPLAEAPTPEGTQPVVVTARRRGELVGVARGWTGGGQQELTAVLVAPEVRGQGITRHLTSWFRLAADRLEASPPVR
jgi:GNAT superfamily N-acetyltransferase